MSSGGLQVTPELLAYVRRVGMREAEPLRRLREETARLPESDMQVAPEEGALLQLLVRLLGARRALEIGTFTGYSALAVALAVPELRLVCCDVSREWTDVARRHWTDAGVADRIDLRLGPARESLEAMLAAGDERSFDFAFIDADKPNYDAYHEACLRLVRRGGVIAVDNTLWSGRVVQPDDDSAGAIAALNDKIAADERGEPVLLPMVDGLTLVLVR